MAIRLRSGSKNVWAACRHQLLKVSQEQLRMATTRERVADDVIQDPPPPSTEEFTQASPEERAERHERFESRSSGHVQQGSPAQPHNPDSESPSDGTLPDAEGS